MVKVYEIIIAHEPELPCPQLPDHPDFKYREPDPYTNRACPAHEVFYRACDVAAARHRIELLKRVKGLRRITLYYGGDRKDADCWTRERDGQRWEHQW